MALMTAAAHAMVFRARPDHLEVDPGGDMSGNGLGEAGPASTGIIFIERTEQGLTSNNIHVDSLAFVVPKRIGKRRFGAFTLGHNTEFVQFQGRYLFTGLIPFALFVVLGWDAWRTRLQGGDNRSLAGYVLIGLPFLLIPLDLWLLWRVIPGLAP